MSTLVGILSSFDLIHTVLLVGTIVGGLCVGIGIVMEYKVWNFAAWLVVVGIIIEPIFTLLIFVYDEHLSHEQNETILAQNIRIEAQQQKIDEAEKVTLWQLMPRMLGNVTGCREILRGSPKGATVKIVWRSDVSDGKGFAFFVSTCLVDPEHQYPPKWDIAESSPVDKLPDSAGVTGLTVISNKLGNWITRPQTAGQFIMKALHEGVPLHMGVQDALDPNLPDDTVVIAIGPKLP